MPRAKRGASGPPARKQSGSYIPHAQRKGHRLEVYLSDDAAAALERLLKEHTTARTAVEVALLERAAALGWSPP